MGKAIRAVSWLLFFLFAVHDLRAWGGLAITPDFGARLLQQASLQSPLAATYLYFGRKTVDALGRRESEVAYAARHFKPTLFTEAGPPELIVQRTLAAQSATGTLCYYGAPLLLVLSLALHTIRQKPIRSFGGRG